MLLLTKESSQKENIVNWSVFKWFNSLTIQQIPCILEYYYSITQLAYLKNILDNHKTPMFNIHRYILKKIKYNHIIFYHFLHKTKEINITFVWFLY